MSWNPTRRTVLKTGAAAAGVAGVAAMTGGGTSVLLDAASAPSAFAAPNGRVVVLFLRGGQDHLSTVVPYTEAAYYAARPTIAIPAAEVLDLNGQFGFHPTMTRLHELYQGGRLAVVVGAANLAGNRSHFSAQDLWEYGAVAVPADGEGWLGRYLNATKTSSDSLFRGLTVGDNVNTSLRGYPALGIGSINDFGLGGLTGTSTSLDKLIGDQYAGSATVESTGTRALDASGRLGTVSGSVATDPVTRAFADLAILLDDGGLGIEVVTVNIGNWDTHTGMGNTTAGRMRDLLAGLDGYLGTFQADLDARGLNDVTTVVMTEFGRRVAENGTGGLDHGFAETMFVLGGHVNGGHVYGPWAGLSPEVIGERGDVVPGVDFRNVLCDVAHDVLGVAGPASLFPGHTYARLGVTT
jgi:uncharacterized protein (DUF1501 family)